MPAKTIPTTIITLGLRGDISINNIDLQLATMGRLQKIVNQLIGNGQALKNKITEIGMLKVKILLIKRFMEEKLKPKRFLTQIKLRI